MSTQRKGIVELSKGRESQAGRVPKEYENVHSKKGIYKRNMKTLLRGNDSLGV